MKYVIVEDEQPAFEKLRKIMQVAMPDSVLLAHLEGIEPGIKWFAANPHPDLVFMDIHLSDGSGFELLKRTAIRSPIIFTTAYDEYAIQAFKTNCIDYLMKPVKVADLEAAISKLVSFGEIIGPGKDVAAKPIAYKKRFLIRLGDHIRTIDTADISYFFSHNRMAMAQSSDGNAYPIDYSLDMLESVLNPDEFFRINRQFIISLRSIEKMRTYSKARVLIHLTPAFKETPIVSSEKANEFKKWLGG